jgi:predicted amidophosphoribosyltransferase
MAGYLRQHEFSMGAADAVVAPVSLHPRRLRGRGYNQSSLLAKEAGKLLNLPVREDLLKRVNDSSP